MTHPADPRARQLAEAVHGLARQKATKLLAWQDLPISERERGTTEARLWLRAAVEAGIAPPSERSGEAQQPETARTPCSDPPCDEAPGQPCAQHEEEQAHAEGEHAQCGPTCEVQFPTEQMRNFILSKGYPGSAGMLDELLRRAAASGPSKEPS